MAGANEATGAKGGSADLEAASDEALGAEAAAAASSSTTGNSQTISSLSQLSLVVSEHVGNGAAAERVMSDSSGFRALLDAAGSAEAESQDRLGGNAALMGKEMASLGAKVMLGGRIGPAATALIGDTMQTASGQGSGTGEDDTHLILEYGTGEAWRSEGSPRANRFIVTQDQGLADIQPLRDVITSVNRARDGSGSGFDADVVVVAGLHMLEQLPEAEWRAKLDTVSGWLQELPSDVAVHIELASIASSSFMEHLADKVVAVADSVGMNEQELADLYEAIGGRYAEAGTGYTPSNQWPPCTEPAVKTRKSLTGGRDGSAGSHSMPRIDACLSASRHVMSALPSLTRLHLHTLGFHAVFQASPGQQANSTSRYLWRDAFGAVASGATTAAERACSAKAEDLTDADLEFRTGLTFDGGDSGLLAAMKLHGVHETAKQAYDAGDYSGAEGFAARAWMMARPMMSRMSPGNPIVSFQRPRNADTVARAILSRASVPHTHMMDITVAPVPVCKQPKSTVGLGDAISAAGLVGHATQRSRVAGSKLEFDPIPPAERVRITGTEPSRSRDEL
jgi:ADP-dependent phosphofructokinase/glucokinase